MSAARANTALVLVALAVTLALVSAFALAIGTDGWSPLWSLDDDLRATIGRARFARVGLAAIIGAGLAATGAALQAVLRNPLADPYVLGVSGGAALGAALATSSAVVTGAALGASLGLGAAATLGALAATALLGGFLARGVDGRAAARSDTAILVGVTVNAFSWALVGVLRAVLPAASTQALSAWLIGSLGSPGATDVIAAGVVTTIGVAGLALLGGPLGLLATGEDEARRLGVDVRRTERIALALCSLLVGVAVATSGVIGFVGLIAPHAVRALFTRLNPRALPLASALFGAVTLVALDAVARAAFVVVGSELPTGAVCAVVGAPLFAVVLWRKAGRA